MINFEKICMVNFLLLKCTSFKSKRKDVKLGHTVGNYIIELISAPS